MTRTQNVPEALEGRNPLNLWERVHRARAIAAARAATDEQGHPQPVTWEEIGRRFTITERQARRIYADFCAWEQTHHDPMRTVDEAIMLHEGLMLSLSDIVESGGNMPARVGAARVLLDVNRERLELLQAAGKLPRNLARFRAEADFMDIARQMVDVLRKRGVPAEVMAEIRELTERYVPQAPDNVTELRPRESSG